MLCAVDAVDKLLGFVAVVDPDGCEVIFEGIVGCDGGGSVVCSEGAADENPDIDELFIGPPYTTAAVDVSTTPPGDDGLVVPEACLRTGLFLRRTGCASVLGMARTDL
jgi:hypothetical protein